MRLPSPVLSLGQGNTGLQYNRDIQYSDIGRILEEIPANVGVEGRVQEGFLKEVTPELSLKQ